VAKGSSAHFSSAPENSAAMYSLFEVRASELTLIADAQNGVRAVRLACAGALRAAS